MTPTRLFPRPALLALVASLLAAAAASCTVGPDYKRPELDLGAGYRSASTQEAAVPPRLGRDWWRAFGDPALNDLEDQALAANTDVRAAVARVAQARESTRITASQFYPAISFNPAYERTRSPPNGVFIGTTGGAQVPGSTSGGPTTGPSTGGGTTSGSSSQVGRTSSSYRTAFDLTYEIDVWGRVRRSVEASTAQQRASEADFEVVLQTIEADVAQNYFTLRSLDAQDDILRRTVQSYQEQVGLTQVQFRAGLMAPIDLYQALALLDATVAQRVDNRRQRADVEHALAVLLGRTPGQLSLAVRPLDLAVPGLPAGLPAELLRRRPDVARAEQDLATASANIGVAEADFYPTVRLSGAAGFQSFDLKSALNWEQRVWSFGPSVSFPLFVGGRLEASLEQAKARFDESLAGYRGSVLAAVRDVEDSLTDLHHRSDEADAQARAVAASREYLRLSQIQYKGGLTNYLLVIDAERTLLNNELTAAQILNQRLVSTVLLIKSLGGGWDAEAPFGPPPPVEGPPAPPEQR